MLKRDLLAKEQQPQMGEVAKSSPSTSAPLLTRRSVLNVALLLPAAGVLGCNSSTETHAASNAPPSWKFFTPAERTFVESATERLIPDEQDGLGAKGAGVALFIDGQLDGSYGRAEHWYMQGPWAKGTPEQGYQLKLTPAKLYQAAIPGVNEWCQNKYSKIFAELTDAQKDEILTGLENGDIELKDAPGKDFFSMLLKNTVEGFLADPMYGGNRNFAGWKLVGFPGPRYNYVSEIEQYGRPYPHPTVGILGRDGTRLSKA